MFRASIKILKQIVTKKEPRKRCSSGSGGFLMIYFLNHKETTNFSFIVWTVLKNPAPAVEELRQWYGMHRLLNIQKTKLGFLGARNT